MTEIKDRLRRERAIEELLADKLHAAGFRVVDRDGVKIAEGGREINISALAEDIVAEDP